MKQHELKKISEQKKKDDNIRFVSRLKNSNSNQKVGHQQPVPASPQAEFRPKALPEPVERTPTKLRSNTRKSEAVEESQVTLELDKKKAFLRKIRNISFKK